MTCQCLTVNLWILRVQVQDKRALNYITLAIIQKSKTIIKCQRKEQLKTVICHIRGLESINLPLNIHFHSKTIGHSLYQEPLIILYLSIQLGCSIKSRHWWKHNPPTPGDLKQTWRNVQLPCEHTNPGCPACFVAHHASTPSRITPLQPIKSAFIGSSSTSHYYVSNIHRWRRRRTSMWVDSPAATSEKKYI